MEPLQISLRENLLKFDFDIQKNSSEISLTPEDLNDLPLQNDKYEKIWKNWVGKEEEFYIQAYECIQNLDKKEFDSIMGLQEKIHLNELKVTYQKMMTIPETLMRNPLFKLRQINNGEDYEVKFISIDVSFALPVALVNYFDGQRSNEEIIELLLEKNNIEIDQELISMLYHFNVLKSPSEC